MIKKLFAIGVAITALTAITAISASADGLKAEVVTSSGLSAPLISDDGNSITVQFASGYDVQNETTVLLFKGSDANVSDEDILYINQDKADDAKASGGFLSENGLLPKVPLEKDETYTMRVSDETNVGDFGDGFYEVVFTVAEKATPSGSTRLLGNVTDEEPQKINVSDAVDVSNYTVKLINFEGDVLQAADANDDGKVNVSDVVEIRNHTVKLSQLLGTKTVADKTNWVK